MTSTEQIRQEIEGILEKHSEEDFGMEPGASWTVYRWPAIMPELLAIIEREKREAVEEALGRLPRIKVITGFTKSESMHDWIEQILSEMFPIPNEQ